MVLSLCTYVGGTNPSQKTNIRCLNVFAKNTACMHTGSENAGWLMSVDMASLAETRVFDLYDGTVTSLHISGKAFNKPGWVAVSAYNCKEGRWVGLRQGALLPFVLLSPELRVPHVHVRFFCNRKGKVEQKPLKTKLASCLET